MNARSRSTGSATPQSPDIYENALTIEALLAADQRSTLSMTASLPHSLPSLAIAV
jgi:hypothetical protein